MNQAPDSKQNGRRGLRALFLGIWSLVLAWSLVFGAWSLSFSASAEKEQGLAEKYPNDRGIGADPAVILWDDFERADLKRWDENQIPATTKLARDPKIAHAGNQCVQMTAIVPGSSGGGLIKWFSPGHDTVYARFYVKFAKDAGYVHHFVHLVGGRDQWSGFGKAGLKPDGTNFFTTGIEPEAKGGRAPAPGVWHFYTYWPDMKGSPGGKFWGNDFSPKADIPIPKEQWICVEMMLKANSAGKADGEQAFWINGHLAGRYGNFRWRTTDALKVNAFWLLYYVTPEAISRAGVSAGGQRYNVYFDDVVVARKYIGPMKDRSAASGGSSGGSGKFTPPPGY